MYVAVLVALVGASLRPVGFEGRVVVDPTRAGRRLAVSVWYPAARPGAPLTYRAYTPDAAELRRTVARLAADPDAPPASAPAPAVDPGAADRLLAAPIAATRGAPRAAGRFPLVILVSGSFELLGEHLAGRGYVVVGMPARAGVGAPADAIDAADDLAFVVAEARRWPGVADRVGTVAFSASALAPVVYQARTGALAAMVSLDGWDGMVAGRRVLAALPGVDPRRLHAPWLLAQPAADPLLRLDPAFFRAAGLAERRLVTYAGASHFDFVPLRGAAVLAAVTRDVDAFLDATLARAGAPPPLGEVLAAAAPFVDPDDVRARIDAGDIAGATARLRAAAPLPDALRPLGEAEINQIGYTLLARGRTDDAVTVLEANVALHPRSANVHDSLGEALLARGDRDRAIASYRRAVAIDPAFVSSVRAVAQLTGAPVPASADPRQAGLLYRAPAMASAHVTADVPYAGDLRLDVYRPADARGRLPVVVFVNGVAPELKGWAIYRDWGRAVASAGLAAVVYQARGNSVADSTALLAYLEAHADELGIDSERVCLWAASANGHVGTRLAADPSRKSLRCAAFYYAISDAAPRGDLPLFVVRAGRDAPAINDTIDAFVRDALAAGAPLEFIHYRDGQHGFDARDDTDETRRIVAATLAFFVRHLAAAPR
jgi:dienelactone hydrolase